ncbi:ComF family protein [bacterium]|nr:ComF family protein [bacterium]
MAHKGLAKVAIHPAAIEPIPLHGHWREGYALATHTLDTDEDDPDPWHARTQRTPVGELLYRLKYRGESGAAEPLADALVAFIRRWDPSIDVLVPVSPTRDRALQPVWVLGAMVAEAMRWDYADEALAKAADAAQIKNLTRAKDKREALRDAFIAHPTRVRGRRVLLLDDLYRSGASLNAAADALVRDGGAEEVCTLAVTMARTRR